MMKLRLREIKQLAQGHTATEWLQRQTVGSRSILLIAVLCCILNSMTKLSSLRDVSLALSDPKPLLLPCLHVASSYDKVLSTPTETKLTSVDLLVHGTSMEPGAASDSRHSHLVDSKATHAALKCNYMQFFLVRLYPDNFCLLYSCLDISFSFF